VVKINILNWVSGGVLSQYNDNSKLRLVAFFFAKYFVLKYNYKIYNKEFLAIVKALEKWCLKL